MFDDYAVSVLEKAGWRIFDGYEASMSWPKIKDNAREASDAGHDILEFRDTAGDMRHHEEAIQYAVVSQILDDLWG